MLALAIASPATGTIAPRPAPHLIALSPIPQAQPTVAVPVVSETPVPEKRFMKIDRKLTVPVRTHATTAIPLRAPMLPTIKLQPIRASVPLASDPSISTTLDLFDRRSAPLPSPGNFYKSLRSVH